MPNGVFDFCREPQLWIYAEIKLWNRTIHQPENNEDRKYGKYISVDTVHFFPHWDILDVVDSIFVWENMVINNTGKEQPHILPNDTIFTHIKQIHSNKDVGNFNMAQRDVEIDFMSWAYKV